MEFRTKREARRAARMQERKARVADGTSHVAAGLGKGYESECLAAAGRAEKIRAEAARIRALLPGLEK